MPLYCDVALPVSLDQTFTYAVNGVVPAVGARVLVPFSGQRLMGVVLRVHDDTPNESFEIKPVQQVLDDAALLPDELTELARWIAAYYVAPLGEVLRGMLPLGAEVKRHFVYRISDVGRRVLYEGAAKGASRRSKLSAEEQNREYAVLNYLETGDTAKMSALRSATGANKTLLEGMVRKKWLTREAVAEERDARRLEKVAVIQGTGSREQGTEEQKHDLRLAKDDKSKSGSLGPRLPKLNENQLAIMGELAAVGGRMRVRDLRQTLTSVPESTLATLVKRGLVAIEEVAREFWMGGVGVEEDVGSAHLSDDEAIAKMGYPVHRLRKKHAHEHALNEAQMEALSTIAAAMSKSGFAPHLLYGVTGSGKTTVYFAAMQRALEAGKSALLLVPEIGLTPAMTGQLVAAFGGEVALLHSQLTPDERAEQWHRIRRGEARVVVGTRSAVFAPMPKLGLIIVDEEHDGSYKQEETPRYHGRDVAVMRAKLNNAVVVLGSATPSLESWANAEKGRYVRVEMRQRVADRPLPAVELVDMREEFRETGQEHIFSRRLIEETQATLDRGEQAIVLLNRRGYSFVVMCRSCGAKIECENCAISMTYHKPVSGNDAIAQPGQRLECHYCGYRRGVPKNCPKCGSEHLYFLGAGSQQGEERLQEIFPSARIGRMDRDTVRGRSDMERLLSRLHAGEINLLVGTQMIAKGHDIHGVTLVGVVGADFALGLPDFRAAERVFQLLTQVSGRAGRGELPGKVLVQTYHPDHYAIQFAAKHDYPGFVAKETQYRRWMHYPPYSVLANVLIQSEKLEEATGWSAALGGWFERARLDKVRVLGPAAAPISRLKRIYRYHFVLKAERRQTLSEVLRAMLQYAETQGIARRNLIVDVDAVHLM
ncbi:MAG TPA: primosomal protein N' [Edaphobacter sp.]|nr:primosomal protein N' [Edaphobacter sp.]